MNEVTGETPGTERRAVGPWGPWATLGFGFLVVLAMFLAHTLVVIGLIAVQMIGDPQTDIAAYAEELATNGLALALGTLLTLLLGGALILLFCVLRRGPSIGAYLGLAPIRPRHLAAWIGASAALILASDTLTTVLGRPLVPEVMVQTYRSATVLPIYWLALVVAGPLFEELLFRGFLLEGFRRSRLGNVGAAVLTSIAWAAVHQQYGLYELATIFVVGLVLAAARVRTGSLYTPILLHAGFNLVSLIQTALFF